MAAETVISLNSKDLLSDLSCAVIVPETAIAEAGHIRTLTGSADAHSKHEFHALAQMAYFQYQDDELEIVTATEAMVLTRGAEMIELTAGLVIGRDVSGRLLVAAHEGQRVKKLLEAAYRFCTRWVRLDI